jgi:phosphoglycerol transferase MdoB-like AlkP superfamily enzyme
MIFRMTLLAVYFNQTSNIPAEHIIYALFNRGSLFDENINCLVISIPFILLSVSYFLNLKNYVIEKISVGLLFFLSIVCITLMSAEIPYFGYYNSRITKGILSWSDDMSTMIRAVLFQFSYLKYFILAIIITVLYIYWIRIISKKTIFIKSSHNDFIIKKIFLTLITGFIIYIGIRGEYKYDVNAEPLKPKNAFFSDYSFPNQLGYNGVYTFFDSFKYHKIKILDDNEAIENVRKYLNIKDTGDSPIARNIKSGSEVNKYNIVLVLIESLSANRMKRYGNINKITPNLDSLANVSLVFDNFYSAGIHTWNGIMATLFGYPSVLNFKQMNNTSSASQKFSGIAEILKQNNYHTIFFCAGDKKFDNMNGFLLNNGFDEIISNENYPKEWLTTFWGAPDEYLYEYAGNKLTELSKDGRPFFATILTTSSHEALELPRNTTFKSNYDYLYDQLFEYTDWSIGKFLEDVKKETWFNNTIFIFTADHGQNFDFTYDMSLSYHHIPLIIYSPNIIKPEKAEQLSLQIDLYPTILGILNISYVNNTFGIDLFKQKRDFAFFSGDESAGCIKNEYFLVLRQNGTESLYKYKNKDVKNYLSENEKLADSMKRYTISMLQVSTWLIDKMKAGIQYSK